MVNIQENSAEEMEDFVIQYRIIVQLANMESCMESNSFTSTIRDHLINENIFCLVS